MTLEHVFESIFTRLLVYDLFIFITISCMLQSLSIVNKIITILSKTAAVVAVIIFKLSCLLQSFWCVNSLWGSMCPNL